MNYFITFDIIGVLTILGKGLLVIWAAETFVFGCAVSSMASTSIRKKDLLVKSDAFPITLFYGLTLLLVIISSLLFNVVLKSGFTRLFLLFLLATVVWNIFKLLKPEKETGIKTDEEIFEDIET